jgi:hypothetical protein
MDSRCESCTADRSATTPLRLEKGAHLRQHGESDIERCGKGTLDSK